jgi:formylglycine-generating enzyme required for sulfatase activity
MERVDYYRLPTEAQWEYACRAGSSTRYHFGDDAARLGEYAWYDENSGGHTHPVGQKQPNAWELYDMHGNVMEWVQDRYGDYPANPVTDPIGPAAAAHRVFRGSCWSDSAWLVRSAYRHCIRPSDRVGYFGFRCASSGREPRSGA